MVWKNRFFWFVLGLGVVFVQSFFLISWPVFLLLVAVNWFFDSPWFISLGLGFVNDLFQLNFLGHSMLVFLVFSLILQVIKQILGWSKTYQIKVSDF